MATQWHTPFHAPWAVARPHGYQLSGVGQTRNEEGSAPPLAACSLGVLWVQELGATHFWEPPLGTGWSFPQSPATVPLHSAQCLTRAHV